ncbi:golgin subfamily A member 4-like isoform X2 [Nylanderia fulva]|uniref:golgin subfamily A member 4-like isoform X2 n=1 Tax=Nylanderia fulva TaxID=613905 RepID=UPI0010FB5498|nr:golgin subfamily A member 4-like isoform X2 [Nylanderia fulva]
MFKKFKDKLAEEMKQSPARLQASVQQLAQAVVSPALSNSSIQEVSASSDNFSLTEDGDETPKNTPAKHSFQNVDLMSPSPNLAEISRRSSVSSVTSDASSLFPMYESPSNLYHLQSDMDQSASEVDDNISPHLDRVTKDQLYSAYRKVQAKYHKYRGRYTDLAAHYRELDRVKSRLESVLVETQDKVLRRITDLKEQCQLEQQAKAHLEEALRNDIEEKDHIISTLNTKVKLLQTSGPTLDNSVSEEQKENSKDNLIDLSNESPNENESSALSTENAQLKDKLKKLENLVLKYKESLKRNKDKFTEVMKEKNALENDHEALKSSTAERISATEGELNVARVEVEKLTEQVATLHKREEESAISLAENKLSVHRELEEKEEQIKQLQIELKHTVEDRDSLSDKLNSTITRYKTELSKLGKSHEKDATDAKEKVEMVNHGEETRSGKDENTLEELTQRLREKDTEVQEVQRKLDESEKQNVEYKHDKEALNAQLMVYKEIYEELKEEYSAQKIIREDAEATIEKLQATVQSVDKELENMRSALIDRDQVCENYNRKIQQYTGMVEKAKHKLAEQETQIKSLKDKLEDRTEVCELQRELENKKAELSGVQSELECCRSSIDDLKNKVQADSSALSLLKKERSDLINRLVYYNDCMQRLKKDCAIVRSTVSEEFSSRQAEMSNLNALLAGSFLKLEEENATLKSEVNNLHSKMKNLEQFAQVNSSKEMELESELTRVANLKVTLEAELRQAKEQLREMTLKNDRCDELNAMNNKLIAEIDNLTFKVHDLEKASQKLTQSQQEVCVLEERLRALENLEAVNHTLSLEIDDLREKHSQAGRVFKEVDELNARLREATEVIDSLKSESGDKAALQGELHASRSELARLRDDLAEREDRVRKLDEQLESTSKDNLTLKEEYETATEIHARETAELVENNKELQETISTKLAQLKKLKMIKERQSKTIEEANAELDELKTKHAESSRLLETSERQIEMLKSENIQLTKVALENKDLKDKHNDLLSHNQRLCENEEALKQRIKDYEKDLEELRNTMKEHVESYKSQLDSRNEETDRLKSGLTAVNSQLESKEAELGSLNERLAASERELREVAEKLEERSSQLRDRVSELDAAVTNGNVLKEAKEQLLAEQATLKNRIVELENADSYNAELQTTLTNLQSKKSSLEALREANSRLHSELDALQSGRDSSTELDALKDSLTQKDEEIRLLEDKTSNMLQEIGSLRQFSLEVDERRREVDSLRSLVAPLEQKVAALQSEIGSLTRTNDALRDELEVARNDAKCQLENEKLHEEKKRLEAQLDEALITFQAKETQMTLMSNELKAQANQLKEELKTNEEEQGMRLKQLVKEFQAQLHDKEEELQAALEKRFDRQQNYESNLVQQYKEQLKDCQIELTEKSEQLESLVLENKDAVEEKGKDIDRLVETIAQIKDEQNNEIKELEKKWKAIVQQKIDSLQSKHEDELNELTKEWQNERKELESTSRVAMAAIQTSTGSIHTLQQTLTSQRREIAELRKLVKLRHDTLEDSTEIEYLRNILFEYMMGRETMVLARVIAAVVKFDQEQTTKILKKEEDKLTLFGSLGLS